jgi:hypothetical protein
MTAFSRSTIMRTSIALSVALLFSTGIVPAQDQKAPPAKPESGVAWGKAVEGLQCWLEADRAVWMAGEVPTLRLHVRDQGTRDLVIHMAQCACKLEFDGAWFDWQGPVSIPAGTWPAGRQYEDFEVRVSLEAPWSAGNKPIALKPGKHTVRVAYVTLDNKQPVRVVSNAVEIQVADGKPVPRKDTDQAVRELAEQVNALRRQLETIEKRLKELEKAKDR